MSPEPLFEIHLVLGYVASLLCFGVYVFRNLKLGQTSVMPQNNDSHRENDVENPK